MKLRVVIVGVGCLAVALGPLFCSIRGRCGRPFSGTLRIWKFLLAERQWEPREA
jgi:hypothetical protein